PLTIEHQALLLRIEVEGALLLAAFQLAQATNLLLDRLEVREHAAEPPLRHMEGVGPLGLTLDDGAELLLRADEENALATGDHLTRQLLRQLDLPLRLPQVDDVDSVAFREDELPHLRVPPAGLVTEMNAGFQEILDLGGTRHEGTAPLSGPSPFRVKRLRVDSATAVFRSIDRPQAAPDGASGGVIDVRRRSVERERSRSDAPRHPTIASRTGSACGPSG